TEGIESGSEAHPILPPSRIVAERDPKLRGLKEGDTGEMPSPEFYRVAERNPKLRGLKENSIEFHLYVKLGMSQKIAD
ncbi:MAG: hypothetical protein ACTSVD_08290, partial [Candidatus Thorarchaeota archaeon]